MTLPPPPDGALPGIEGRAAASASRSGRLITVTIDSQASVDRQVRDVDSALRKLEREHGLAGGGLIYVRGPIEPHGFATVIHHLAHRFSAVAVAVAVDQSVDRQPSEFVVAVTHGGRYALGQLVTLASG